MRIVFMALDDEFAGSMQFFVYERDPACVVGSIISTCAIYRKSPIQAFWFVLRKSGWRYGAEMFRMKIIRKVTGGSGKITPSRLAAAHRVRIHRSADVNSAESLAQLREWAPDLIVCTNFSHYVGADARNAARIAALNLHKSLLPYYRGMAPSFYALLNGEKKSGATLHKIAKGIDCGDIVCQTSVPIEKGDTVYSLNQKTSEAGGRMLAELLEQAIDCGIESAPQPDRDWTYYTYPSPADVRRFLRRGGRF